MLRLWLAEEGEDDLELFGGEEFAFGGVGGFGEFVHQWLIGGFRGRGVFLRSPCCGRGSRPWQGLA